MSNSLRSLSELRVASSCSEESFFLIPRGFVTHHIAKCLIRERKALPFSSDNKAYTSIEIVIVEGDKVSHYYSTVDEFLYWLGRLPTEPSEYINKILRAAEDKAPKFAGINIKQPILMGILNVTPDSFSDGGEFLNPEAAIDHGLSMKSAGAQIIDVGGESTRPGAVPVPPEIEKERVLYVIKQLVRQGCTVSVDTRNWQTMLAALDAGACIVNDVTALSHSPNVVSIINEYAASVVLMHMQGEPTSMQQHPNYLWAPTDIYTMLKQRIAWCINLGISRERLCVDPGIGFGKSDKDNLNIIGAVSILRGLGCAVMLGSSRKGFIGRISNERRPQKRVFGTIAADLKGVSSGVDILRVHDVREVKQALILHLSLL
ncbi:MAG: dihydropteroate synthase [Rhodospirillaceae bacterium]|nr:dihydropteroate synthase [Rhodospirillaceae bacterium]